MFLNRDFAWVEVTIFPEKTKSFNILLKMHKTNTK